MDRLRGRRPLWRDIVLAVPPACLIAMLRRQAFALATLNVALGSAIFAATTLAVHLTGDAIHWAILGLGVYAITSWLQWDAVRDPSLQSALLGNRRFLLAVAGLGMMSFVGYGYGFWLFPFLLRRHDLAMPTGAMVYAIASAGGGFIGVLLGGLLADRWSQRGARGRVRVCVIAALAFTVSATCLLSATTSACAYLLCFPLAVAGASWLGPAAALIQELTPVSYRARAASLYLTGIVLVGLALGPYAIGRASDAIGSLREPLLGALGVFAAAIPCLLFSARIPDSRPAAFR